MKKIYFYIPTCVLFTFISITNDAYGVNYSGERGSFIPLGSVSINAPGVETKEAYKNLCRISNWSINNPKNNFSSYLNIQTIDGWTGTLQGELLYVVYSGSVSVDAYISSTTVGTYTTTYNSSGVASTNMNAEASNGVCFDVVSSVWNKTPQPASTFFGNVKVGVYIPKSATPGTYTLNNLYITRYGIADFNSLQPVIKSSDSITVIRPDMNCAISPPEPVDFGTININSVQNGDVLSLRNGDIEIMCNDPSGVALNPSNVKVRVSGNTGRYSNTLKMNLDTSENAPAEIRGFIGPDIEKIGVCDGNTGYPGWIQFTNGGNIHDVGTLKEGVNKIPYSFSLCSNGGTNRGNATAQATIIIDWD